MQLSGATRPRLACMALGLLAFSCSCNGPTPTPSAAALVYVRGEAPWNTIVSFSTSSSGNATPVSTLTLPPGFQAYCVATDSQGQIYIGALDNSATNAEILVYAPDASGNATPTRTITVPLGVFPWIMAVDGSGRLYVGTQERGLVNAVFNVYAATANGAAAPIRTIQLPSGGPSGINDAAVDAAGNLYVAAADSSHPSGMVVVIYSTSASGVATPARIIVADGNVDGVAVDAMGDVYANVDTSSSGDTIEEFAPGANGAALPIRRIQPALGTNIGSSYVRLDAMNNVYVATDTSAPYALNLPWGVAGFGPNATGNATPSFSFNTPNAVTQAMALH